MSATRSGTIYSNVSKVRPVSISIPKTPTPISRGNIVRPTFFEPAPSPASEPISDRTTRPNRTQFSQDEIRDLCAESDNDSTSSYDSDDMKEEEDQIQEWAQQYYMTHSPMKLPSVVSTACAENHTTPTLLPRSGIIQMQPKYDVNIDFDEASKAWRENKRRVGESWVYKREKPAESKKQVRQEASRLVRRSARVAATKR